MRDSYQILLDSIERRVGSELTGPLETTAIHDAVSRTLGEQSRTCEHQIGRLRLLVLLPLLVTSAAAAAVGSATGPFGAEARAAWTGFATIAAWCALAALLVRRLGRGWYKPGLRHAVPVADAAFIVAAVAIPALLDPTTGAPPIGPVAALVVLCMFLSGTGGLRLSRSGARFAAMLSAIAFLAGAVTLAVPFVPALVVLFALVAIGLGGSATAQLIRRLIADEVSKAALSNLYADAQQAVIAREEVLKIVSHDLRNPLHTISMCASLMLEVEMPPEKRTEMLRRMRRAGERMDTLIRDLLDIAKLQSGRVAIKPVRTDLVALVREAHDMLEPLATERRIACELVVEDPVPWVMADSGRVLQVISNLVGNALKFTEPGGRITLTVAPAPAGARVSVRDTGPGIAEDQVKRLFERFWQADATDRRGLGLGLTIANAIIDAHDGRIWVESVVGEGTTFHFALGTGSTAAAVRTGDRRRSEVSVGVESPPH